jgi:TRAP-type mannitol/chloroaromatic compound transport system permease small subunit
VNALLGLSRVIDAFNLRLGRLTMWFVLAAVLISATNAIVRKAFNISSNAYLEIQWYLFAAVFMLGVGYVWLKNAHVRIDFVSSKLSKRTNTIIDIIGMLVFTIPLAIIMISLSWPLFARGWTSGEMSQNAGGLIRWPVLLLIPAGFAVLLAQTLSELVKRIAFLKGLIPEPTSEDQAQSEEDRLLEALADEAAKKELALKEAIQKSAATGGHGNPSGGR